MLTPLRSPSGWTAAAALTGLTAALLVSNAGCQTDTSSQTSPSERAVRASARAVDESRTRAAETSDSLDTYELELRHNPPRCPGPDFEIYAHGRWNRVFVDGDDDALDEQLEAFRQRARQTRTFATVRIRGQFKGRRRADNDRRYRVFRIDTFVDTD